MRRQTAWITVLAAASWCQAEIIDRIGVTVGKIVITESEILDQIRVAAFLNGESPDFSGVAKRRAAQRLTEQVMIRHEMEVSRYPAPELSEAEPLLERLKKERFADEESYPQALQEHRITEQELKQSLLLQLTTLRFIQFRFRPGVSFSESEVRDYYQSTFLPEWARRTTEPPPTLEDSQDDIETILTEQRIDQALELWLTRTREQTAILYREEVFE